MNMTKEWAAKLKDLHIEWEDNGDTILLYDPLENPDHVVIREEKKSDPPNRNRRIGVMSFEEFAEKFKKS